MPIMKTDPKTVEHLVAFAWKPGTSQAHKDAAAQAFKDLAGQFDTILDAVVGTQISKEEPGDKWHFGFRITFVDRNALEAYVIDKKHTDVVDKYIKNDIADVAILDIERT